jgi:hypothetical protein
MIPFYFFSTTLYVCIPLFLILLDDSYRCKENWTLFGTGFMPVFIFKLANTSLVSVGIQFFRAKKEYKE